MPRERCAAVAAPTDRVGAAPTEEAELPSQCTVSSDGGAAADAAENRKGAFCSSPRRRARTSSADGGSAADGNRRLLPKPAVSLPAVTLPAAATLKCRQSMQRSSHRSTLADSVQPTEQAEGEEAVEASTCCGRAWAACADAAGRRVGLVGEKGGHRASKVHTLFAAAAAVLLTAACAALCAASAAADDAVDYGLWDAMPAADDALVGAAAAGFRLVAVAADYCLTRRLATCVEEEKLAFEYAVQVVQELAEALAGYNTDAALYIIENGTAFGLPPGMLGAFQTLLENLETYKSVLESHISGCYADVPQDADGGTFPGVFIVNAEENGESDEQDSTPHSMYSDGVTDDEDPDTQAQPGDPGQTVTSLGPVTSSDKLALSGAGSVPHECGSTGWSSTKDIMHAATGTKETFHAVLSRHGSPTTGELKTAVSGDQQVTAAGSQERQRARKSPTPQTSFRRNAEGSHHSNGGGDGGLGRIGSGFLGFPKVMSMSKLSPHSGAKWDKVLMAGKMAQGVHALQQQQQQRGKDGKPLTAQSRLQSRIIAVPQSKHVALLNSNRRGFLKTSSALPARTVSMWLEREVQRCIDAVTAQKGCAAASAPPGATGLFLPTSPRACLSPTNGGGP
eukprot:gene49367-25671_t